VGLKLIQVLPVNDTTASHSWLDSYPYSAISAFALHPLYLNLEAATVPENQSLLEELEPERKRLNALDTLDYEAVTRAKLAFLRKIYPLQKNDTFETQEFKRFFTQNKHWLVPYSAFCYLRDKHGTADFNRWPSDCKCSPELLAKLTSETSPAYDEVALNYFIQFHLHVQLKEAAEYAHTNGIILKGDIPIGVYRQGADVWQQPDLYHTDVQAGAPPDPFSDTGQNWSFPTYDWERMKLDGFAWWKRRFEQMSHYFDAFRIDHILGFFRIWSIPINAVDGLLGYFVPAIPVSLEELLSRGIRFEPQRFLKPYITNEVLQEIFGANVLSRSGVSSETSTSKKSTIPAPQTVHDFLNRDASGNYSFKPEFASQRQVEKYFAQLPENPENTRLKLGLYTLVSNVILLEAASTSPASSRKPSAIAREMPRQFHFRFFMERTSSFRNLERQTQNQLKDLYIDYFFRRQDAFWMKTAMEKLPALKRSTNMLICGEDLGLVPSCVPEVMRQLGLLSLEIQRMPKDLGKQFSRPQDAPYLSVVTPSTHDMSTIRGWWTEDKGITQQFFNNELGESGPAPAECTTAMNKAVVLQHLASPAMWSIFQLQDLLGMDETLRRKDPHVERINVPANPKNYWRYRMHLSLETLLASSAFNSSLRTEVQRNGR
jgi:4-alpha-glucanotransferase